MTVLALQIIVAAVAGLWLPVCDNPLFILLPVATVAWWFAGMRGVLAALIIGSAMYAGIRYQVAVHVAGTHTEAIVVSGCVVDFPRVTSHRTAFTFAAVGRSPPRPAIPRRLYVTIYDDVYPVRAGGCYDLLVRIKPAHGQGNAGQFDRETWFFRSAVVATGYVLRSGLNRDRPEWRPSALMRTRVLLREQLIAIHGAGSTALMRGLTLGDRSGMGRAQWNTLRITGTTHLVAISGLHIGMVATAIAAVGWWAAPLIRLSPAVVAAVAGSVAAIGYALLAGWSIPTSRAATMFVTCAALWLTGRGMQPMRVLGLAAVSGVAANPVTVLQPGFWMSYLAVALLLSGPEYQLKVTFRPINKVLNYLISLVVAQWRLTVGLLLPGLLLFGVWAPLAPLINLVAIPVFSLAVLPLTLTAALAVWLQLPGSGVAAAFSEQLLNQSMTWLDAAIELSGAGLLVAPGPAALAALLAGSALILGARNFPVRIGGVVLLLLVLVVPSVWNWRPGKPELRIDVLDVGQGTAVLVQTRGHAMLLDAGPAWRGGDSGAMVVVPVLETMGLAALDMLVVSHGDNDHAGGATSVMQGRRVRGVMAGGSADTDEPHWLCRRGMRWTWDGVEFRVLHPRTVNGWSRNDASCVLSVRSSHAHVLLPGDVEEDAEAVMLARADNLRADLVVVPHHGSRTSSGNALVTAIEARFAVYTTGFRNRWGFPHPEVASRWEKSGSCALNTALTGQLTFVARQGQRLALESVYKAGLVRPAAVRYRPRPDCATR